MIRPPELIPYARHEITPEDEAAVLAVLRSKWLTQGPKVEEFEAALAERAGARYAICVSSGTAALQAAYSAIHKPHDARRIVTSPITFVATANAAILSGFPNVSFPDVDSNGLWHPSREQLENPLAILVPVTLRGEPICWETGRGTPTILVDACHGPLRLPLGALAACFSFHPVKHVACGEGGAVVTDNTELATACRAFRDHGRINGQMQRLGANYRMTDLQAALGLSQLARYDANVTRRRQIAEYYDEELPGLPRGADSAVHLYQLRIRQRDEIRELLRREQIGTQVHYQPVYRHPWWAERVHFPSPPPEAERFANEVVSIPMFPGLTDAEVEYVATTVKRVVEETQ